MPPRFAVPSAPKCAKCGTSVYHVEQVIGPLSKIYHKQCLTCVVCNKRLDSTLLLEHDGEPYCKSCHREHLGTGKGGFVTAVNLNPTSPKQQQQKYQANSSATSTPTNRSFASPKQAGSSTPLSSSYARSPSPVKSTPLTGLEDEGVPIINVRSRTSAAPTSPQAPPSPTKASSRSYGVAPTRPEPSTPIRSIDEAVSARSAEIRDPITRLAERVGVLQVDSDQKHEGQRDIASPPQQSYPTPSANFYATPSPPSSREAPSYSRQDDTPTRSAALSPPASHDDDEPAPTIITTRRVAAADTIGSVRLAGNPNASASKVNTVSPLSAVGTLPPPRRPDASTLTGAAGTVKVAPPRMTTNPHSGGFDRQDSSSSIAGRGKSGIERLGLGSSIVDAGGGTPLCARCHKAVYFAEQKAAAGRKWHRGCLRCDGCSTTLDTGKIEEGPADRTYGKGGPNTWCRVCYAKYFGPKNLAVGFSLPETAPF